ncbi:hypothetical protein NP493_5650g00000 [Ridgeia piscesae]|uniref:Uncharacterized protein n=1 Tax=Ridgeia piscesae TaxID=27915 RepID=A0AAD9ITG8_RIDPI|nr:hypothetical protein NP493_5650g00000 [Ridgeia piscesae]
MYLPTKMCPSRPYTRVLPGGPMAAWSKGTESHTSVTSHKGTSVLSAENKIWDNTRTC